MRETLIFITARNISTPLLTEMSRWLGASLRPDADDDDFLRQVWQEVGDDLRGAMKRYPLEQAAADAARSLPVSTA